MSRLRHGFAGVLAAGGILSASIPVFALSDAETGFGIEPPAPFVATRSGDSRKTIPFLIDSNTGSPRKAGNAGSLCRVSLTLGTTPAGSTQAALNDRLGRRQWRASMREGVKASTVIASEQVFDLGPARGVEFTGAPVRGMGGPDEAWFLSLIDAPKGRVNLSCTTTKAEFPAALVQFRALRASILLPR